VNDESIMDIDSADSRNPLAVTEYVKELYEFYRDNEVIPCVFGRCFSCLN
jgi:G2/mitotic-specific cyclin-B, other